MSLEMIADIIMCAASFISFMYGLCTILVKKSALYLKMVVMAVACIMISRINIMLQYLTNGEEIQIFHVGLLGLVGCFMFLLSANYGEIDRLADDGSRHFLKYRLLSWLAPVILLVVYVQAFLMGVHVSQSRTFICSVVMLVLLIASRFHLKHLIFPDVDYGIVRQIRGYNTLALILCLATTVLLMGDITDNSVLFFGAGIVMSVCCLIILPLLRREAARWTMA